MPAKLPPAERYARDVLAGRIVACRWVRKACQRHVDDLKHGADRGLVFDRKAAQRALDFFSILCHSKGEWAGQPLALEPWQQFITWVIFGWKRAPHARWIVERNGQREDTAGTRRFRTAYIEVARKSGKSTWAAGIMLYLSFADEVPGGEPGAECYTAAPLVLDTPIPTPTGWTTMGDVKKGDLVFDEKGHIVCVDYVSPVLFGRPCFQMVFNDKTNIVCDGEHRWPVISVTGQKRKGRPKSEWDGPRAQRRGTVILTTKEIANTIKCSGNRTNHAIEIGGPLEIPDIDLPVPPYTLGAWLGDGRANRGALIIHPKDAEITKRINADGFSILVQGDRKLLRFTPAGLRTLLRKAHLLDNKHIPAEYLRGSINQRLALLQGLMDTDGTCTKTGECRFTNRNKLIADGVWELVVSLGLLPNLRSIIVAGKPHYIVSFKAPRSMRVFELSRKFERQRDKHDPRARRRYIVDVRPVKSLPVRCIGVDAPSHLYLVGRAMIRTHNTKRDQARIVHGEAVRMVRKSAVLRRNGVVTYKDNIHQVDHAQRFEPLGADSDTMDGLNIHAAVLDELHAHKTRAVWDVLETATGSRRQPLILAITTAGTNRQGVCYEKHEYTRRVLERIVEDDTWFGIIYTLDEQDDWRDEAVWIKANPNLGVSKKWSDMRVKAERAKSMPSALNAFKQKELNCWVQGEIKWMPMDAWGKCAGPHQALDLPEVLAGHTCYSGLDLSSKGDLTALIHVFPPLVDDDPWYVVCRFWCPEDNLVARVENDAVAYDIWRDEGYLTATPGNVIDYDWILDELEQDLEQFQILGIPYDRWNAEYLRQMLLKRGLTIDIFEFGQGYQSMSPAMKELERLVLGGKLAHGNNPVLTWMADNLIARSDPAGNIKPDKERSKEKIDGIVALIMGLGWALRNQGETGRSVYEDRGVVKV